MTTPDWMWNEIQQVGTDYADTAEVAAYDARMATFRDVDAENRQILDELSLPPGSRVLEIGCGTGRFVRAAARAGLEASAADVSRVMLDFVRQACEAEGLLVGDLQHGGFLTMEFREKYFDAVVSDAALHHLPDAWKLVALRNIARVLKQGGQLHLGDIVFSLPEGGGPEEVFEQFAASFPTMRKEAARHAATEFSTYDWIMEGLICRAGFEILKAQQLSASFRVYHCRRS